ncbi:PDDEXK nuclease domain-containing protein [Acidithiobacillus ferrianus]|uniref:PDDEXK nuclease domain-containing protein n=1 Tax=Acidithiobacillus ferrianus TaxID=2678518 RepID=UPI0034E53593
MSRKISAIPADYADWLADIKTRVATARQRAALAANAELIRLYWQIGRDILQRQSAQGWGSKVIERLARDLRAAFPEMKGFSARNLMYMRDFAEAWPDAEIVQQLAAQLPWFHIVVLITRLKDDPAREWYARRAIAAGWSRVTLELNIRNRLHERQGQAVTNFDARLPVPHSELAHETLKDPYLFDFLGLGDEAHERDIENALVRHITKFLLELGSGFAFIGRQFRLEVEGDEFFVDLLFYHTRLKCYVVVELQATAFKPEHAGQLNFYLTAVDRQIKAPDDKPTIGLLLCKTKKRTVAEYALSGIDKPIGVAEYQLVRALPEALGTSLPTVEELESELGAIDDGEFEAATGKRDLHVGGEEKGEKE